MEAIDVLYTPLDVPEPPEYDVGELRKWIDDNYESLSKYKDFIGKHGGSAESVVENYPWDLTVAYFNLLGNGPGWLNGFDEKFPELSKYVFDSFGVDAEEVGCFILLPMRAEYEGYGFWHRDVDPIGFRMYLDFEGVDDDKLLMKRTKVPYSKTDVVPFVVPITDEQHETFMQKEIIECKIKSRNQCFFLNNQRSIHVTYTAKESVGKARIASFVVGKFENNLKFKKSFDDMIVKSAEKFKDYAILWKKEGETNGTK
jgi:hypothetical protein